MKKLNNKGFTLVELLAVIIILAIVVGISIPAITNVINDSKNNALGVAVDSAEKYASEQYNLMSVNDALVEGSFKKIVPALVSSTTTYTLQSSNQEQAALLKSMGFDPANVTKLTMQITATGDVCIIMNSIPTSSQYYTTAHWVNEGSKQDLNGNGVKAEGIVYKSAATQYKSKSCS